MYFSGSGSVFCMTLANRMLFATPWGHAARTQRICQRVNGRGSGNGKRCAAEERRGQHHLAGLRAIRRMNGDRKPFLNEPYARQRPRLAKFIGFDGDQRFDTVAQRVDARRSGDGNRQRLGHVCVEHRKIWNARLRDERPFGAGKIVDQQAIWRDLAARSGGCRD